MTVLNLMVDIDEVIFPLGDSIHDLGHKAGLHDNSMPWSMWEAWKQYGCAEAAYWDLWADFSLSGGYTKTPPIQHQIEALRHLYFEGHRINLVTARGFFKNGVDVRRWTAEWIEEFAIPHHTLTFTKDKPGAQAELGRFDLAVDDSPTNYVALERDGVNVWMQAHPHNAWFRRQHEDVAVVETLWDFAERVALVAAQGVGSRA
jgi:hypothetical protein